MDLIIILGLIIIVAFFYKDFKKVVYFISLTEILFRLVNYIGNHIHIKEIANFVNKNIPSSLINVISKYADGLLYDILIWVLVLLFCFFEYYLIKLFIKRK